MSVLRGRMRHVEVTTTGLTTPVGPLGIAVSERGLCRVDWSQPPGRVAKPAGLALRVIEQLEAYFTGELREFDLPIDWSFATGTRLAVLQALHRVPYGTAVTYGELAELSGTGVPPRAIGGIMGANPMPIVVPCHRVVAHDGLGGYSGGGRAYDGREVKRWLLVMEGALPPTLDWDPAGLPAAT